MTEDALLKRELQASLHYETAPQRLEPRLRAALEAGEVGDALLLLEAAEFTNTPLDPTLEARFAETQAPAARLLRQARECGQGFFSGEVNSITGLGCSIGADFTVIGDVRDLVRELPSDNPNKLIVGLAAAGLALEAGTVLSGGTAAPAKAATSALKASVKNADLSKTLLKNLNRAVNETVDINRLRRTFQTSGEAGLRQLDDVINPQALRRFQDSTAALWDVQKTGGLRAMRQTLKHADSLDDFSGAARVARHMGDHTAATIKVLGRGALRSGRLALKGLLKSLGAIMLVLSGLWWIAEFLFGVIASFISLAFRLAR